MFLGYVRVSTEEQARRTSPEDQERVIRGLAMTKGITGFDVAIYSDPGVSGSIPLRDRPAGQRLLGDVKPGDIVCASKLDRMFRNALDAQETYRDFKEQGIDLILYDLGPDPVTRSGGLSKVFFQIVSVFADAERERIGERMRDGKRAKKAKGGHTGGVAPFGWKIVGKGVDARLEPEEGEQQAVQFVKQMWRDAPPAEVTRALNRAGFRCRAGTPFYIHQVQRLAARELHAQEHVL